MKKLEFDIMMLIDEVGGYNEEYFSQLLYRKTTDIKCAYENLLEKEFVFGNELTEKAKKEIKLKKIDNAIILAAGMSSRFVPFNYELPKGLLEVKGEVLIERQIRQLHEKGIHEIIIVVGYMKEKFEYLKEKYGVILVETDDYEKKNNHASVYAARKYLKNTIITSSDLYFTKNIFQTYAYDAYYCTVFMPGKTAERGIETDLDDRILKTMYGDKCYDIWVTLGYAYFSKRFSDNFTKIMEKEFDLPETNNKFWADIQDEHLEELFMYAKRVNSDTI